MADDNLLIETPELVKPKFTAFGWQLNRMEILLDQAINGYARIDSSQGRNTMVSAMEMLYVALRPKLTQEDRDNIVSYLKKIRDLSDSINSPYNASETGSTVTQIRREAMSLLEIMNLLKDRKGYGIPNTPKISWQEELASAMNVQATKTEKKDEKKEGDKSATTSGDGTPAQA